MSDNNGNWPTWFTNIVNKVVKTVKSIVERVLTVKKDVPLYSQGNTNLCWAYTQIMVEDYKSGIVRTQKEAEKRAIQVAKKVNGDNWNRASVPQNRGKPVSCKSCIDLFLAISKYGPLNASYGCYEGGQRVAGHSVVVTGVNVVKGIVYTNNPWGIYGEQSYEEFIQIFAEGGGEGWKLDDCYRLD